MPNLNICQNSSVAGGGCSQDVSTFTCSGDAIQCATLQQVAQENCTHAQEVSDLQAMPAYTLGAAVLGGNDPAASTLPSPTNATTVDVGSLSASGFLGGGGCFPDVTVSLIGQSMSFPFSSLCQYLISLRAVVMVIASLASFRILSGTFLRE
jgi:hypothetical protein